MSKWKLLMNSRAGVVTPPPAPVVLQALTIDNTVFLSTTNAGDALAGIVGKTDGSTISIVSDDGTFALSGDYTDLLKGLTDFVVGAGSLQLQETHAEAVNSPKTSTIDYTVTEPAVTAVLAPGAGWTVDIPEPTPTVFDLSTPRVILNRLWTHNEVFTSDLKLPFGGAAEYQLSSAFSRVEFRCKGNAVVVASPGADTVIDPRTGANRSIEAFWVTLDHAAFLADGTDPEIYAIGHSTVPSAILQTVIGPFRYFARASKYDTIIKVARNAGTYGGETPDYTGADPIKDALAYKAAHPSECVGIKILEQLADGERWTIGAIPKLDQIKSNKYKTEIFTRTGVTAEFGDYSVAGYAARCDKLQFGAGCKLITSGIGNGSSPFNVEMPGIGAIYFWGCEITQGDPGADGATGWTGSGAEALYRGSMPTGYYVYPATQYEYPNFEDIVEIDYGFCNIHDVGPFGPGYATLVIGNVVDSVTGSIFENLRGAAYGNTVLRGGGSETQPGLRGFTPAFRLNDLRAPGSRPAYVALEKPTLNGVASLPLEIIDPGEGYTVDGTWNGDLPNPNPVGGNQYSPALAPVTGSIQDANANITISGGQVTAATATKSGHFGAGGRVGDIVEPVITGVTCTRPAQLRLGGNMFLYEGTSAATAVVVEEYLVSSQVSYKDFIDHVNANWDNWSATDLNSPYELDTTYITRSNVSTLAGGISKSAGVITGGVGTFHIGVDVHRNNLVWSRPYQNILIMHNDFGEYVEMAPFSCGRSSGLNGIAIIGNTWHDRGPDLTSPTSTQQGYWQGAWGHVVMRDNSGMAHGGGIRFFFGTGYTALPNVVSIRNNIFQSHTWAVPRVDAVGWKDNLWTNMTQDAVDTLSGPDDGASKGIVVSAETVFPGFASRSFTPAEAARLSNGVMPGAFDVDGSRRGY